MLSLSLLLLFKPNDWSVLQWIVFIMKTLVLAVVLFVALVTAVFVLVVVVVAVVAVDASLLI